jgi:hypothetical protein
VRRVSCSRARPRALLTTHRALWAASSSERAACVCLRAGVCVLVSVVFALGLVRL